MPVCDLSCWAEHAHIWKGSGPSGANSQYLTLAQGNIHPPHRQTLACDSAKERLLAFELVLYTWLLGFAVQVFTVDVADSTFVEQSVSHPNGLHMSIPRISVWHGAWSGHTQENNLGFFILYLALLTYICNNCTVIEKATQDLNPANWWNLPFFFFFLNGIIKQNKISVQTE